MRTPIYQISIEGNDVSSNFNPVLLSLTVRSSTQGEGSMSTADIELDDTNGQIATPREDAAISISLGYSDSGLIEVFTGVIHDLGSSGRAPSSHDDRQKSHVASQGSRSQGRIFVMTAYSGDQTQGAQTPVEMHQDGGSFQDFISKLGAKIGLDVKADGTIGQATRDYWHASNESFLTVGARYMRELGGTMQMFGKTVTFTDRNSQNSVSGIPLTGIRAVWGDNLIAWSVQPTIARPRFGQFGTRWYDMDQAKHMIEQMAGTFGNVAQTLIERFKHANQGNAGQNNTSNKADSDQNRGEADEVTIEGDASAQCNASCSVSGIRDDVDGSYTITSVVHHLSRHTGFVTILGLNMPQGGAGDA